MTSCCLGYQRGIGTRATKRAATKALSSTTATTSATRENAIAGGS
jgi:hypothetical protein